MTFLFRKYPRKLRIFSLAQTIFNVSLFALAGYLLVENNPGWLEMFGIALLSSVILTMVSQAWRMSITGAGFWWQRVRQPQQQEKGRMISEQCHHEERKRVDNFLVCTKCGTILRENESG